MVSHVFFVGTRRYILKNYFGDNEIMNFQLYFGDSPIWTFTAFSVSPLYDGQWHWQFADMPDTIKQFEDLEDRVAYSVALKYLKKIYEKEA